MGAGEQAEVAANFENVRAPDSWAGRSLEHATMNEAF